MWDRLLFEGPGRVYVGFELQRVMLPINVGCSFPMLQVGSEINFALNLHAFLLMSRINSISSRMTKDVGTSHKDGNLTAD